MSDIEIDASELNDVLDDFETMDTAAGPKGILLEGELSDKMIKTIQQMVNVKFDNVGEDDKNQVSLANSFKRKSSTNGTIITSTAPHAKPLEDGVIPHYITPDTADALNFVPENINKYPEAVKNDDGTVTVQRVFWEPDKNPGGWDYIHDAQEQWDSPATRRRIADTLQEIIRMTRFQ